MKEVENEAGQGHFILRVQLGTSQTEVNIGAIDFQNPDEDDRYFSDFSKNEVIRAARFGTRGMCGFRINPAVTNAEMENEYIRFREYGVTPVWRIITGEELIGHKHLVDTTDTMKMLERPNMRVKGTFLGKQFTAQIIFVSSPQ